MTFILGQREAEERLTTQCKAGAEAGAAAETGADGGIALYKLQKNKQNTRNNKQTTKNKKHKNKEQTNKSTVRAWL